MVVTLHNTLFTSVLNHALALHQRLSFRHFGIVLVVVDRASLDEETIRWAPLDLIGTSLTVNICVLLFHWTRIKIFRNYFPKARVVERKLHAGRSLTKLLLGSVCSGCHIAVAVHRWRSHGEWNVIGHEVLYCRIKTTRLGNH